MAYVKKPTKAQKQEWIKKAKEQEEAASKLISNIATNYKDSPETMAELFEFGSRFYDYSPRNNMLILSQNRHSTYVQSYDAWKKMGYPVNAKERGLKIFVPVNSTVLLLPDDKVVALSQATKKQVEDYKAGKLESRTRLHFKIGNVFDISQTTFPKEDYPKMFCMGYPSELHNDVLKGLIDFSQDKLNCPVYDSKLDSITLRGYFSSEANEIHLNQLMEDTQKLSTMAHELGHALIHHIPNNKSTSQKEFEADALSIMIQSNYGLELTDVRKSHLAGHFKSFKEEIEKSTKDNFDEVLLSKLDEIYSTVFSVYRDNIDEINKCVERYVPREKLMQISANKDLEESLHQNLNETDKNKETSFVQKACITVSNQYSKSNTKDLELELER